MNWNPLASPISRLLLPLVALAVAGCAAAPAQATFPGTPGPIAYSRSTSTETGTTGGIFAHGPRRSQRALRLTSEPGDSSPSYSADGRTIAFVAEREALIAAGRHIYLMNSDGGDVRPLTSGAGRDANPSFSPSGRQVVFDRSEGSGDSPQIFVVNVDGSGLRRLTAGPGKNYDPVFTPNGRRIVFVSDRDHDVRTDRSDIFSMAADGSDQRILIDGPRNESEPDVSPNGRSIVFSSNRRKGPNLFVARSNGTHVRALTHSRGDCFYGTCYLSPAWAPDGRHIAFLAVGRYKSDLDVMRADGSQDREFDSGGTEEEGYGTTLGAPAWGPAPD
jgi:Tol biopolymer transport system component